MYHFTAASVRDAHLTQTPLLLLDPKVIKDMAVKTITLAEKVEVKVNQLLTQEGTVWKAWCVHKAAALAADKAEAKKVVREEKVAKMAFVAAPVAAVPPLPPPLPLVPPAKVTRKPVVPAPAAAPPPQVVDRGEGKRGVKRKRMAGE